VLPASGAGKFAVTTLEAVTVEWGRHVDRRFLAPNQGLSLSQSRRARISSLNVAITLRVMSARHAKRDGYVGCGGASPSATHQI